MKKSLLFLIVFYTVIVSHGQTPTWTWAKNEGGSNNDMGYSVTTDHVGNVYVTGYFTSPSITFGTITLINNSTANNHDIFIVKYDSSGNELWAKNFGGTDSDWGYSICVDISNNVYVTGWFRSASVNFGSQTLNKSEENQDLFLVKLNTFGNVLWATSAYGSSSFGVTTDTLQNVYITGDFGNTITFGAFTLTNIGINTSDVFIVKYDSTGNVIWANSAKGFGNDVATGIASDKKGNVFVTGYFNSPQILFGIDTLFNTNNLGYDDIFITKYSTDGNVLWTKKAGGIDYDWGNGISTDKNGNAYITGYIGFPSATFDTFTVSNYGGSDVFIAKYDSIGNVQWAKHHGTINNDEGLSISADSVGNSYVTGWINNGGIFVNKYDLYGNLQWNILPGGGSYGNGIKADDFGGIYVTGSFTNQTYTLGSNTLVNHGMYDFLIAKLSSQISTGITENKIIEDVSLYIYPIPFSTQTTLTTLEQLNNATISIDNSFGQTVKEMRDINGLSITLYRDNLPAGLYFLQLKQENKIIAKRKIVVSD